MNSETNGPIAVIAVHGVADQQPGETARAIANMLLREHGPTQGASLDAGGKGIYSAFTDSSLHVAVGPVYVGKGSGGAVASGRKRKTRLQRALKFHPHGELLDELCEERFRAEAKTPKTLREEQDHPAPEASDIRMMKEQVESYHPHGAESVYETTVFKTIRISPPDKLEGRPKSAGISDSGAGASHSRHTELHLFEMYWADLSRAGHGIVRLLVEFYQLLFYLPTLGRKCIEFARLGSSSAREERRWKWFGYWQLTAEQLLVLGIPILNLCLAGLAAQAVPLKLQPSSRHVAATVAIGVFTALTVGFLLYFRRYASSLGSGRRWRWLAIPVGVCTALSILLVRQWPDESPNLHYLLSAVIWLIAAVGILWLTFIYQQRKSGAFLLGATIVAAITAAFFLSLNMVPAWSTERRILKATMLCTEVTFITLCACWVLFGFSCMVARVLGWWAICAAPRKAPEADPSPRALARKAAWTVHLTLVLPALLSAVFNIATWEGLYLGLKSFILDAKYSPILLDTWIKRGPLTDVIRDLIGLTGGPYFALSFFLVILAALFVIWTLLPIVATEFKIPSGQNEPQWLGTCLDACLQSARVAGEILWLLVLLIPFMYLFTIVDPTSHWIPAPLQGLGHWLLGTAGGLALLFLSSSKLPSKAAGLGFRAAVDISMDVANWFRLNPVERNPKARITSRFVSLLRHVCNAADPRLGKYKAIVIVSHSQGTVIASEVLRFLKVVADPLLTRLGTETPVYLFTMGSPLRQLYKLRFPHQYHWGGSPNPEQFGICQWVNAYRSGDYVGRALWADPASHGTYDDKIVVVDQSDRRERCIGSGAHTKYWDESAPKVAEELDRLIALACQRTAGASPRASSVAEAQPKLDK